MSAHPDPSDPSPSFLSSTSPTSREPASFSSIGSQAPGDHQPAPRFPALLLAILLGLAALVVGLATPPYQSPDSFDHLRRAAAIASGQWVLTTPPGSSSGAVIDTGLQAHMALFDGLAHRPESKIAPQTHVEAERIQFSGQSTFVATPGTGLYAPPIYVVHAAGWAIGQALGLTVGAAYRLVAVLVLLACVAILAVAFRIHPPTPITFALLALPMTVYQLGSPTIDGICTSLFLLWLAIYLRGLEPPPAVNTARTPLALEDALLVMLAAILVTSRLQMWPMLLLLAHRAWRRRSSALAVATLVCTLAIAAWIGWAMGHSVDGRVVRPYSAGQIVRLYLSHPGELAGVLGRSLVERAPGNLRSFIGVLGWMDAPFRLVIYGMWMAWLTSIFVLHWRSRRAQPSTPPRSAAWRQAGAVLAVGALLSIATVVASLLIGWTPYPAETIKGIQGRYFLPAALMLAAAGSQVLTYRAAPVESRRAWQVAIAFLVAVVPASALLVVGRYSPSAPWPAKMIMAPGTDLPERPAAQGSAAVPPRRASNP